MIVAPMDRPVAGPDSAAAAWSFDDIYRDHVGFVWRNLRRLGVPEDEIEDAAHEVFMVVLRRLPEFDGGAAITTWLYAIARGVASNRRRGELRRLRRHAEAPAPLPPPSPIDHLERARAAADVARFLAGLDPDQRAVFELFEIEGLRAHEIAEALDLNVNTVYTRLRAARQRFVAFVAALHQAAPPAPGGSRGSSHG
ncbi:MAG TPA: sigma-70 family RNA polymerase sigma factor [Nannocystis sp.]